MSLFNGLNLTLATSTFESFLPPIMFSEDAPIPQQYQWMLPYAAAALTSIAIVLTGVGLFGKDAKRIPHRRGIPFLGSWSFYTKSDRFISGGLKKYGGFFSFNLAAHKVVAVRGEVARKAFYGMKEMNFDAYQVLLSGAPMLDEIETEGDFERPGMPWYAKRLAEVLKRDKMDANLPLMMADLERLMAKWGAEGTFNPFEDIYHMVFQLTMRVGSSHRIADDPERVQEFKELYNDLEKAATPTAILLPWFPGPARKRKTDATTKLYMILKKDLDDRVKEGRRYDDAVQMLLDTGDDINNVVQFVLATLFAGIANSGIVACWILVYLDRYPEWKARVISELRALLAIHKISADGKSLPSRLAALPATVWEESLTAIELCLTETLRRTNNKVNLRRFQGVVTQEDGKKVKKGVVVDGKEIQPGTFLAIPNVESHLNGDIFEDPLRWDPSRFERGEDKKQQWSFVGWGVGRHPCLGMRFAKLEIKVLVALFLLQFDYTVVDAKGNPLTKDPEPNMDDPFKACPTDVVPYIRYKRISD